jgi:indolepyruvate ferredoxin oxidoreductase alpha subunit
LQFLEGLDEVLCIEELDPVIERALLQLCGKHQLQVRIRGKLTGDMAPAGENTMLSVGRAISSFLGLSAEPLPKPADISLPVRPPVLCAGCPHRASFYAVKQAMKGKKTIYCGDIGCYTLGNAMPLDMCDTCLCMGAGINIAQGVGHLDKETKCFAFVGDSTFFASAICGVVNAIYNKANMTLVVLDNATTAMTGHQPHPGTGRTMMGEVARAIDIEAVLKGIGVEQVRTVDPLDQKQAVETVKELAFLPGVKAIIFRSPCIALFKPGRGMKVGKACISCKKCLREIGCPALYIDHEVVKIDTSLCNGCGLCQTVCPVGAICTDEEGK